MSLMFVKLPKSKSSSGEVDKRVCFVTKRPGNNNLDCIPSSRLIKINQHSFKMANNSMGQGAKMPTIGTINQNTIKYVNNPIQSPQLQASSIKGSPSQHNPMNTQSQVRSKANEPNDQKSGGGDQTTQLLSRPCLQALVREVDPTLQLDEEVEEMLRHLADDFIDTTVNAACAMAKHRNAPNVELKDVQLHLERQWNMWIPGIGNEEVRPYQRPTVTDAHKKRMALIRKTIKKN